MAAFDLTSNDALAIAGAASGRRPVQARRFPTGLAHFVFEIDHADGIQVVLRAGHPDRREGMAEGVVLQARLRPMGVPLPRILATGFDDMVPWVLMERLPGSDLGDVIGMLSPEHLGEIASAC